MNQLRIIEDLDFDPSDAPETRLAQLSRLWSDRDEDAGHRRKVHRSIATQSMEFREHNIEYGYTYESEAIVDDGSTPSEAIDPIHVYEASTRTRVPTAARVGRACRRRAAGDKGISSARDAFW